MRRDRFDPIGGEFEHPAAVGTDERTDRRFDPQVGTGGKRHPARPIGDPTELEAGRGFTKSEKVSRVAPDHRDVGRNPVRAAAPNRGKTDHPINVVEDREILIFAEGQLTGDRAEFTGGGVDHDRVTIDTDVGEAETTRDCVEPLDDGEDVDSVRVDLHL